jgi:DNA-binding transcriptional LysR family regulator
MKISLDALAVLDAIDRRGSFAAAAVELDRVPSAVTYIVRRLEDDLDVLVFDRRGHRAQLTPAGRELLDAGRLLLRDAGEIEHRVKRVATGWEAELRIAVDNAVPLAVLWPLVAAFYANCRDVHAAHTRLRITTEVFGGTWDALADGRADLAIGASGDPPAGGGYRTRAIAESAPVFAVAPDHPLAAHPEPIPSAAILRHRAVVAADSSRRLPPRTVGLIAGQDTLTVPDLAAKTAAQVAGLGCGFLPAHLAASEIAAGRLVVKQVEEPRSPLRISVAWRVARPGNALAWWIDAVARSGIGQALAAGAPTPPAPAPGQHRGAAPRPRRRARS